MVLTNCGARWQTLVPMAGDGHLRGVVREQLHRQPGVHVRESATRLHGYMNVSHPLKQRLAGWTLTPAHMHIPGTRSTSKTHTPTRVPTRTTAKTTTTTTTLRPRMTTANTTTTATTTTKTTTTTNQPTPNDNMAKKHVGHRTTKGPSNTKNNNKTKKTKTTKDRNKTTTRRKQRRRQQ